MLISKKSQYGLRAVFELAWRNSDKPSKIHVLAESQGIPARFLEVILSELRHAGIVESRRGKEGGYLLARGAADITVAEIILHLQGPVTITSEANGGGHRGLGTRGDFAFEGMWNGVEHNIADALKSMTFDELVNKEKENNGKYVPNYAI